MRKPHLDRRDQRFITRQTESYTFELDRADSSVRISASGRQMCLNSADVAEMLDLLQQEHKDKAGPLSFPEMDVVHPRVTSSRISVYLLTNAHLVLEATSCDGLIEAYTIQLGEHTEKAQALYHLRTRRLGIAWKELVDWQTVEDVAIGIQTFVNVFYPHLHE